MAKIAVSRFRWVGSTLYAILLAALPLLTGCGHDRAKFQNDLMSWSGQRESELVSAWGVPNHLYEVEETRFLTYVRTRTTVVQPTTTSQSTKQTNDKKTTWRAAVVAVLQYRDSEPKVETWTCSITFKVAEGTVESSRYEGNDCHGDF